jgi:septum formation protein
MPLVVRRAVVRIATGTPLALGSASPRRREMVALLGIPFLVRAADIDETVRPDESPGGYLERITRAKLEAVRGGALGEASAVLVADTIVVAPDGQVLGKPLDASRASGRSPEAETSAMIDLLAGATHVVSTRFVLAEAAAGAPVAHAQTITTRVTFRALAPGESGAYAESGEGRDKAGGYAVQGRAGAFIERIEGSYSNVVGLPMCEVLQAVRALGWW